MICPRCKGEYPRLLALSRVDNKTMICDSCGTLEALESLPIRHKTSQERKRASVYRDMRECRLALLEAFPYSFINERNEFIAHKKSNQYFCLENCEYPEDIDCKVLEWLSRAACKGMPYKAEWRNRKFRQFMLDGINKYLETDFSEEDMYQIYTYLGNACHHARTVKFVESGFEMGVMQ